MLSLARRLRWLADERHRPSGILATPNWWARAAARGDSQWLAYSASPRDRTGASVAYRRGSTIPALHVQPGILRERTRYGPNGERSPPGRAVQPRHFRADVQPRGGLQRRLRHHAGGYRHWPALEPIGHHSSIRLYRLGTRRMDSR